jgi:hypothetical protein
MLVPCVVFVVLMTLWLFGGGYTSYNEGKTFDAVRFGGGTLIPWICVAILGWVIFNGAR